MKKTILCFVGLIASGKDVAKKYLETNYQAESFRFSSILRDTLNCLGVENSRDNIISLSTWSRETFGNDLLAKAMANKVAKSENELIIIDGARRVDDLIYLKQNPDFHLIAIDAPVEIRYQRSISRNENPGDQEKSYETFLKDHEKETEITIPETMAQADFKINNDSDLENLYQQVEDILEKLNFKKD